MTPDIASTAEAEGTGPAASSSPDRPSTESTSRFTHWVASRTGFDDRTFVLRVVQPALVVGIATALGAGVSMGFSEALSDTGEETGRGSAVVRGAITGGATAFGGVFHSLPFVIHNVHTALIVAGIVVVVELFLISWVRYRFLHVPLRNSMVVVTGAGAIVVVIGVLIGGS